METSLRLIDFYDNCIRKALIVMNDSYIINRKAYTALFCIGNTEKHMTKDRGQQIQIQIQKSTSLGRLKIEGYKPPAELTGKAVSRGHHLSGPMLVTAKIHPILLSKNTFCRFQKYFFSQKDKLII